MIIEIDTDLLKEHKITANQFLIVSLVYKKEYGELEEIVEQIGFANEISNLVEKKIIHNGNPEGEYDWSKIIIRDRFAEQIFGDFSVMWDEFWSTYPSSVIRPEGNRGALKGSQKKMKEKYKRIVGKDLKKHQHILRLLNFELKTRAMEDSMKYMKTLSTWLNNESWMDYEEIYNESFNVINKVGYGESIE